MNLSKESPSGLFKIEFLTESLTTSIETGFAIYVLLFAFTVILSIV